MSVIPVCSFVKDDFFLEQDKCSVLTDMLDGLVDSGVVKARIQISSARFSSRGSNEESQLLTESLRKARCTFGLCLCRGSLASDMPVWGKIGRDD